MDEISYLKDTLKNSHVFLTGGGGVGKSYLTTKILEEYKKDNMQTVILGSTGISAVHIKGQTIHSFFVFGISNNIEELFSHDRSSKFNQKRIKEMSEILSKTDLLVIDEISMVSASLMDMIRYRLDSSSFRGSILFVGDFFQLPPVYKKEKEKHSLFDEETYAFESSAWVNYNPVMIELTTSKRTDDIEFFNILKNIRRGEINQEILDFLNGLRANREVYDDDPTILYGTNAQADKMNRLRLYELTTQPHLLRAKEEILDNSLHEKKFESWKKALNIAMDMDMRVGARVMFCVNKRGCYYNGEQGVVSDICDDHIVIVTKKGSLKVEPHVFELSESAVVDDKVGRKVLATISQYPIKLAYAITIHKSQGMSIENLVCDIHNIFETSQFYVAISRARSARSLCIDYSRQDFENHIKRSSTVHHKVVDFYKNTKSVVLD